MMKKVIAATIALVMLAAIVPNALASHGDIKPYNGLVGASSPLYPVKIYIQNLDIYITSNNTDKLVKEMNYADERVSEAEAAAMTNDTNALNASMDQYVDLVNQMNNTSQADDINETVYSSMEPLLVHHGEIFYGLYNYTNSTAPNWTVNGRYLTVNGTITKMKNGMPFYYYEGQSYFIPPAMAKKGTAGHVPPGLANKGYKSPAITNGSLPWDNMNYTYTNQTHGNGNGKGNGNGNGNKKK